MVFFVACLVARIVSDMVIVRPVVCDLLNHFIIMEGVKHDMTHGVTHNHILVDFFIVCLIQAHADTCSTR